MPDVEIRPWVALLLVATTLLGPQAHAQGLNFTGIVKLGVEGDTNPRRLNGGGSDFDTVERLFVELGLASSEPGQLVDGSVRIGAKRFNQTPDEDAVVVDGTGAFQRALVDRFSLYLRLSARNRAERGHIRDYVRLLLRGGLAYRPGEVALSAGPLIEYFLYRPASVLSYLSVGGSAQLAWSPTSALGFSVYYTCGLRDYRQVRLVEDAAKLSIAEGTREDTSHFLGFSASWEGAFIAGLDAYWQRNVSNSFGKSFSRLTGRVYGTVSLPFDLFASLEASIQRTLFDDEVLIDPTFAIDNENRNAFVVALSRELTDWLGWELRYNLFTQEFGGDDEDYIRHLVYGGLTAEIGR